MFIIFKSYSLLSDDICNWFEVAPTSPPCFSSRKHHRRILALTSRLAGFGSPCAILTLANQTSTSLPVNISLIRPSLFSQRLTVSSTSHINSPSFRFWTCSFDHFNLWFHFGRFSRVHIFRILSALEPFWKMFSAHGSVHWMASTVHSRSHVLARND